MKWMKVLQKFGIGCSKGLVGSGIAAGLTDGVIGPELIAFFTTFVGVVEAGINVWKHWNKK